MEKMSEIRSEGSNTNIVALTAADVGDSLDHSKKLIDVGQSGDPQAVWITGVYGIAGVAGTVRIFHSDDPDTTPRAAANIDLSLYLSTTGDGLTEVKIGPITDDVWLSSDNTATVLVNEFTITYESVGLVG